MKAHTQKEERKEDIGKKKEEEEAGGRASLHGEHDLFGGECRTNGGMAKTQVQSAAHPVSSMTLTMNHASHHDVSVDGPPKAARR